MRACVRASSSERVREQKNKVTILQVPNAATYTHTHTHIYSIKAKHTRIGNIMYINRCSMHAYPDSNTLSAIIFSISNISKSS